MDRLFKHMGWIIVGLIAAWALAVVAISQGETIGALWIVVAAVGCYLIAYRYYSLFLAQRVFQLDASRITPAVRHNDGLDYVPTNRYVLFGHHFAAIAGAGPLVGPVLAAQLGYLPGMLWLIAGVVVAGGVQDFVVLFLSTRRDGRSLGDMMKSELGPISGLLATIGIFSIMTMILAIFGLVIAKALAGSPWGVFTILSTLPTALFMGIYMRFLRPGRIGEVSIIGFVLLMLGIWGGGQIAASPEWAAHFTFSGTQITWGLITYGAVASILPVWLLLAPRDYLSTFLKIGTIVALAVGIAITLPTLKMPAITPYVNGAGPVWSGDVFPFLFITIACGAVSGFHALVSSGTTPKLIANESDARFIGYGGMLMESFVGIMALIAASVLEPGIYFAMNSSAAALGGSTPEIVAQTVSSWGFVLTPEMLTDTARQVGESTIISRAGGAPTLAVGIAHIFSNIFATPGAMAFWYHFAILFEALFILTGLDAGTRVGRFMLQDLIGNLIPRFRDTRSLAANLIATALCVAAWGYFVYQGVVDPFGGINTLWPLFGISNQMLACMALILATVVLCKLKRERYLLVTAIPAAWLLITTFTAIWQKVFDARPSVGFLAQATKYQAGIDQNQVLAPAKTMVQMQEIVFNARLDAGLALFFALVTILSLIVGLRAGWRAWQTAHPTAHEDAYAPMPASSR